MTAALKRFRANLRALGTSLWFQLVVLATYFYVLYTALGLNDIYVGILAGICTGALLPGIADTIGEKIKKRKADMANCIAQTMGGICGFPRTIDHCPNHAMHRDVIEAQLDDEPEVTDAMVEAAVEALRERYGYLNRTDLQVAILAALRARNEEQS